MEEHKKDNGHFSIRSGTVNGFWRAMNVPWRTIRNWYHNFETIKDKVKRGPSFWTKCYSTLRVKAKYPKMEKKLVEKFLDVREVCNKMKPTNVCR
ncbi:hypothetical protein AAMO2058_001349200 [Amorphochlora amoebiformis]